MKKVTERATYKVAVFYKDIDFAEITNLVKNSFGFVRTGVINGERTLFIKTGEYKISGSVKENKYTSVAINNWLIITGTAVGNNQLLIDKIKVVNPEKFAEMYEIIDHAIDLFSELEEDEEDKGIKFDKIKRKKA